MFKFHHGSKHKYTISIVFRFTSSITSGNYYESHYNGDLLWRLNDNDAKFCVCMVIPDNMSPNFFFSFSCYYLTLRTSFYIFSAISGTDSFFCNWVTTHFLQEVQHTLTFFRLCFTKYDISCLRKLKFGRFIVWPLTLQKHI